MNAGASLLTGIDAQIAQTQNVENQRQSAILAQQKFAAEQAKSARELGRQQQYLSAVSRIGALPREAKAEAINDLLLQFPDYSDEAKRAFDSQSEQVRTADTKEAGELLALVENGATDLAIERLGKRIAADKTAEQDTEADEHILELLKSRDQKALDQAKGLMTAQLIYSAGPDKVVGMLSALKPQDTEFEKQYAFIKQTYGQQAADTFAQNKYDPVFPVTTQDGTTAFRSSQLMSGAAPSPTGSTPPAPAVAPASEDEATAILSEAMRSKYVTPEDFARVEASLGPNGKARAQSWLKNQKIQISRVIGGKRYVKRGNDWFEVTN